MNIHSPVTRQAVPFRFTVDQFIALGQQGLFDGYAKSELIEGEIVCMNAQWSRHARIKTELAWELGTCLRELGSALRPVVEVSVRLSAESLPEPDIVLTDYRGDGAVPHETAALIVEVSDTTLETDLDRKAHLYAAAGVAEYWVVDCDGRTIHRMWSPAGDGYAERDRVAFGDDVATATIAGLRVPTAGLD
jgi:Uma2 family endonuclease